MNNISVDHEMPVLINLVEHNIAKEKIWSENIFNKTLAFSLTNLTYQRFGFHSILKTA